MPKAAILCFDGSYASVIGGFADMLQVANSHLTSQGAKKTDLFSWEFVSPQGNPTEICTIRASNGLDLKVLPCSKRKRFDIVFIPSLHYKGWDAFQKFLDAQPSCHEWLTHQWHSGALLSANCTATFLLADTGLLNGRKATTTWWLERHFRTRFPSVNLLMRPALTQEDRLMCAGAHATFLLQTIQVLNEFIGRDTAMQCARSMLIDVTQTLQTPLLPLITDYSHNDPVILRAQRWLSENLSSSIRISELADYLAVSERTLIRRFQNTLQVSPLVFLQNLRLDQARTLLESSYLSIEQVALEVGYSDLSSFTRLFKDRVGFTPGSYRERFRLEC